jgi:hypothetical protein
MRAFFACACAAFALGWPAAAAAAPSARLVYGRAPGAESCPDEAALREAVSARIGYDPFFPYAPRTVVLTIQGAGDKLTARVELVENEQANVRELETAEGSCDELLESAALAIAIAIDPRALVAPASSEPDPPPSTPAPEAPLEPLLPAGRPPTAERPRASLPSAGGPRVRAAVGPRLAAGLQPGVATGAAAGGALVWDRFSIGAEIESYLPSVASAASGSRVRGWLLDGALVPCLRVLPVSVCGVVRVGRFEGAGERVLDPTTDASLFLAAGGRAGVELLVSRGVRLHLDGEMVGNLVRATLVVGPESVWRAPPVAGILAVFASREF